MIKDSSIAILTPTRNRANNCERFIKSIYNTTKNRGSIELHFYVDNDDPSIEAYKSLAKHCYEEYNEFYKCEFTFGAPMSVSQSWNIIANKTTSYLMIMGNDDLIYRTPNWDSELIQNLAVKYKQDPMWVAWFNDGINGDKHCAFPIISREWYDTVGYFAPGCFNFGYNDTWVFDIAKRLDRTHYIPNILVEHMHFSKGKSEMDDTYARNRTQEKGNLYAIDKGIFFRADSVKRREEDCQKIRVKIEEIKGPHLIAQNIENIPEYELVKTRELKNLIAQNIENIPEYELVFVQKLKKEWAATSHKLKENPLPEQTEQFKELCKSITKHGMKYPVLIDGENRVLRGNQRVWYALDNNIKYISAYRIKDSEIDKYIQKTYINRQEYP